MQISENLKLSFLLFILFLIFYAIQIPLYTSKPDVIVFALRSFSETPILDFAYLQKETLLSGEPLPNYHLGHTLVLWLVYQIFPTSNIATIWPSGLVSSISGALIVVLTFLIWRNLGLNKKKSLAIGVIVGLIPSFWEQSIIGEVYSLQFLFILLFLFSFLKDKILLSSMFFLFANLISPLSGLAFGLIFLKGFNKKTLKNSLIVGITAITLYACIYLAIGSNLFALLSPLGTEQSGRGVSYRILAFGLFVLLNFNFFIYYLGKGFILSLKEEKQISLTLIFATIPQLLLLFIGSTFFIELGSFQLPVFWTLSFPLGYYLTSKKPNKYYFGFALIGLMAFTYTLWISTNVIIGKDREDAGIWLRENGYTNISIIAPWSVGISLIKGRDGSDFQALNKYYFDKPYPSDEDIIKTNKNKLIIANEKKMSLRKVLAKTNFGGLVIEDYKPEETISLGKVTKIYENEAVSLFLWEK